MINVFGLSQQIEIKFDDKLNDYSSEFGNKGRIFYI
jgi:hypothetical protein